MKHGTLSCSISVSRLPAIAFFTGTTATPLRIFRRRHQQNSPLVFFTDR